MSNRVEKICAKLTDAELRYELVRRTMDKKDAQIESLMQYNFGLPEQEFRTAILTHSEVLWKSVKEAMWAVVCIEDGEAWGYTTIYESEFHEIISECKEAGDEVLYMVKDGQIWEG